MTDSPYVAIPQLIYRYARALDRLDAALLDAVFSPDADIDMGAIYRGPPSGFIPVMTGFMGAMHSTRHEVTNILIEAVDDRAEVEAYVTAWHRIDDDGGTQELVVRARYLASAARRDDGWRIVHWREVVDWGAITAASSAWFDANDELPKGRRDRSDASYAGLA